MKKIIALLAAVTAFASVAFAAENPAVIKINETVLLTPFGQSQDANFINLMTKKNKITYSLAIFPNDVKWDEVKSMIVVLGGSGKGLGAAGLDIPSELARCNALLAAAKEHNVKVVAMHIGGQDRRGPNSAPFLTFAGDADFMVVRADGNVDGYFTKLCAEKNVPLYTIQKTSELRKLLGDMIVKQ